MLVLVICRVLVFPPVESYFRLLIHKTVESDFNTLCSFSIGEEDERRTVVCQQQAIYRSVKQLFVPRPELNLAVGL